MFKEKTKKVSYGGDRLPLKWARKRSKTREGEIEEATKGGISRYSH